MLLNIAGAQPAREVKMERRLDGKVAIVTGSGQGIGKGIALRLAHEGARLVIADQNAEAAAACAQEIVAAGGRAQSYSIDVSDVAAVRRMVAAVANQFGRIDVLVNNAGIVQTKPMLELSDTDWDRVLNVNLRGAFFLLQAVAQQLLRQLPDVLRDASSPPAGARGTIGHGVAAPDSAGLAPCYGKIVNLSSVSGRRGRSLQAHYAASKAGIISLTQSAALALAPYRINCNAVCPGIVLTPMWQKIDEEQRSVLGLKPGEAMAAFIEKVPLRRAASPKDIAGAVAFLCSSDADYITGQALNVDGGFEMD